MSLFSVLFAGWVPALVSCFSLSYLVIFLPVSLFLYAVTPARAKKYALLLISLAFYWLISGTLIVYLFAAVLCCHYGGIWLEKLKKERDASLAAAEKEMRKALRKKAQRSMRGVLLLGAAYLAGALLTLKYSGFFTENINALLSLFGSFRLEIPKYLLPIGISFFTLQAISYLFDVYRESIPAESNLLKLALFLSFFPQIVEGPICRYGQTAEALWQAGQIRYRNLTRGLSRILYGLMKKLVVADRLNPLVKAVFDGETVLPGGLVALGALCYTVQLYMDFSGSMDAVLGTAEIFGISLPENFRQPFFSRSISEFWQRWHITLGTWFKDYIFYPLSMSGPLKSLTAKARKKMGNHFGPLLSGSIALLAVWFLNGLWHGAAFHYIFFGLYHFVLILAGNITSPAARVFYARVHINPACLPVRIFQTVRTFILVVFGELFFRANDLLSGFSLFGRMFTSPGFSVPGKETLTLLGVDRKDLILVGVTLLIVLTVGLLRERGIRIRDSLEKKPAVLRWALLYGLILFTVIFGAYGAGYLPLDPIYANF